MSTPRYKAEKEKPWATLPGAMMKKRLILAPRVDKPKTWDDPVWWYEETRRLPERECPKCGHHAYRRYWVTREGRQVGWQCPVDGWEDVWLVQDGWGAMPERPSDGAGVPDPPELVMRERVNEKSRQYKAKMRKLKAVAGMVVLGIFLNGCSVPEGDQWDGWVSIGGRVYTKCDTANGNQVYWTSRGLAAVKGCGR